MHDNNKSSDLREKNANVQNTQRRTIFFPLYQCAFLIGISLWKQNSKKVLCRRQRPTAVLICVFFRWISSEFDLSAMCHACFVVPLWTPHSNSYWIYELLKQTIDILLYIVLHIYIYIYRNMCNQIIKNVNAQPWIYDHHGASYYYCTHYTTSI